MGLTQNKVQCVCSLKWSSTSPSATVSLIYVFYQLTVGLYGVDSLIIKAPDNSMFLFFYLVEDLSHSSWVIPTLALGMPFTAFPMSVHFNGILSFAETVCVCAVLQVMAVAPVYLARAVGLCPLWVTRARTQTTRCVNGRSAFPAATGSTFALPSWT